MLWTIALQTLFSDRGKLLTALVGVIFSVVLVNIQAGLFFGLVEKAGLLVQRSNADIWVGRKGMHNVDLAHDIPVRWVQRIRGIPAVEKADPLRIVFSDITLRDGTYEGIVVVGVKDNSELGRSWSVVSGPENALDTPAGVIVDECDDERLDNPQIGDIREIGGQRAKIVGKSRGILSFLVTPYIFTTLERSAHFGNKDPDRVSYFLVKLKPGSDAETVCDEIESRLPHVVAYPTETYAANSVNFWISRTGLGLSFGAAAGLGLLIGLVMVGQALYAMVLSRLNEFATLKAIGVTEFELLGVLSAQAACVAAIGIGIGVVATAIIQALCSSPRVSISIPFWLYFGSAGLVLLICLASSLLPYLRVSRVDPHVVLQG